MKINKISFDTPKIKFEDYLPLLAFENIQASKRNEMKNSNRKASRETPIHSKMLNRELQHRLRKLPSLAPNTINLITSLNLSRSKKRSIGYVFKGSIPIKKQGRNTRRSEDISLSVSPSEDTNESAWYHHNRLNLSKPKLNQYSAANTIKRITLNSKVSFKLRNSKNNSDTIDALLRQCRSTERSPVLRQNIRLNS